MEIYSKIIIYVISYIIIFASFSLIDFKNIMKSRKEELASVIYIIASFLVGSLIGWAFIEIGSLFNQLNN